jgi:hypothetical protein
MKYRRIPKTSKSLQEKVLKHKMAVKFLLTAGFQENDEAIHMDQLDHNRLREGNASIEKFVQSLGASVQVDTQFDPYAAAISSTAGPSTKDVMTQNRHVS